MKKEAKRKMSDWLMDVAKYVFTAILISSVFKDVEDKLVLYTIGFVCVLLTFMIGVLVFDKNSDNK